MIPEENFLNNGDGTAVVSCPNVDNNNADSDWSHQAFWDAANRPCDTCLDGCDIDLCQQCGDEYTDPCARHINHTQWSDTDGCHPDCDGTGHHTTEVAVAFTHTEMGCTRSEVEDGDGIWPHRWVRCHIIETTPIVHHLSWTSDIRCVEFDKNGEHLLWDGNGDSTPIKIPFAAEPGDRLVLLQLHQQTDTTERNA